ncbi:Stk1 family PASTA domain-containing Ser/Thr kinase [Planobispora longispora]|uniref:PASTA domain-containing protein n=1 Tax=Planobispora longispora TaxID=28887 RepID=A0A8J3RKP0_9ACTN|nr:PASTA domain-containing protein [Planobispora longispora]BFE86117.1 hypothetical protein GCM10020093_087180 [Planobispora longispora]GIH75921.1 hypothetical protein Plo01_23500 [Planobispora longispora]
MNRGDDRTGLPDGQVARELADAMEAHVRGVHAGPGMAGAVRDRHRTRRIWFRTAGAALVTVAIAGSVPVYLAVNAGPPSSVAGPASRTGSDSLAVAVREVTVPEVVGLSADKAVAVLEQAGLAAAVEGDGGAAGQVARQDPAAGEKVGEGRTVTLVVVEIPAERPTPTPDPSEGEDAPMPQDLGDLGDGRKFGGVEFAHLPEGLKWGEWSVKDGFGTTSYSTSWAEPGLDPGMYSVQAVVYHGDAAARTTARMRGYRDQGAEPVTIDGKRVYIVRTGEAVGRIEESGTPTAIWTERKGLVVEIMMSPDYFDRLGEREAQAEMRRIVEGVTPEK